MTIFADKKEKCDKAGTFASARGVYPCYSPIKLGDVASVEISGTDSLLFRFKKDSGDSTEGVLAISGLVPKSMNPTPASILSSIWGYIPAWLFNPGYARDTIRDVLTSKAVNIHAKKTVPFMRKNAKTNLYNIFLNGYLGLFATHGSQHLVDPSSGVKILSLVTLNARVRDRPIHRS